MNNLLIIKWFIWLAKLNISLQFTKIHANGKMELTSNAFGAKFKVLLALSLMTCIQLIDRPSVIQTKESEHG